MSFKDKIFQKVLDKSKSYNYYKENYQSLIKKDKESEKELIKLNNELNERDKKIAELKNMLINKEEGFIFSIVMPIYNTEKYLSEAIDSVINQTFGLNKVQIVLMNDGSTDNSGKICERYAEKYPENIKYIHQENQGSSLTRNNGMKFADGKFINFLDSDDKLELNALEEVYHHINKFGDEVDVISIPRYRFDAISVPMPFYEKFKVSRIVDIDEEYDFPQTPVNSVFLRREVASNFQFDNRIIISEDSLFINKLILEKGKFAVVGSTRYLYRKRPEEDSLIDTKKFDKRYFNTRMELYFKELINYSIEKTGGVLKYIQSVLMYDLKWFFLQNTEKKVLDENELQEFYNHIYEVFQVIDDDIILSQGFNKFLKYHMLQIKYGESNCKRDNDKLLVNGIIFDRLSDNPVNIENISIDNNICHVKGCFKFYFYDVKINMYCNNQLILLDFHVEKEISIGREISYTFNFESDLELSKGVNEFLFEIDWDSDKFPLRLDCNNKKDLSKIKLNKNNFTIKI